MELASVERSILVVIDLQGKLVEMVHRPRLVMAATKRLLRMADLFGVPVMLTEQYPRGIGGTNPELLALFDALAVPKRKFEKTAFGCFAEPGFTELLRELRPGLEPGEIQLVVAGIEAHVCVMQTVLAGRAQGFPVQVVWEAVSGRGAEHRELALVRMRQAGAQITSLESVAFEWAVHKDHPSFKALSSLLKEGQLGGDAG